MKRLLAFSLASIMLLAGCSRLLEREYLAVSPHVEQRAGEDKNTLLEASNFSELKNTVMKLVQDAKTEGVVRLVNYEGDVEADVPDVCRVVSKEDPFGLFAVEYLSGKYTRILSSYEVQISVTYRRNPEQLRAIKRVSTNRDMEREIKLALSGFSKELFMQSVYYSGDAASVAESCANAYYSLPDCAVGLPGVSVSMYPENGGAENRIIEIYFEYPGDGAELDEKRRSIDDRARALVYDALDKSEPERLLLIYDALLSNTSVDVETLEKLRQTGSGDQSNDAFNAYGALVKKSAVSEGFAMALMKLCAAANIECGAVVGRDKGVPHVWNIVRINGEYYHVDSMLDKENVGHEYFLKTDQEMMETHIWNIADYPICSSKRSGYESAAESLFKLGYTQYGEAPETAGTEPASGVEDTGR